MLGALGVTGLIGELGLVGDCEDREEPGEPGRTLELLLAGRLELLGDEERGELFGADDVCGLLVDDDLRLALEGANELLVDDRGLALDRKEL